MNEQEIAKQKEWVRLDNASNIFLAAMSATDTKVFRLSAELKDAVEPKLLQQALEKVYARYPLYHSVLRRGFFWYYLQRSDFQPQVVPDVLQPCSQLYHFDQKELLFRLIYNGNRVHFELFHVLSDGTGALWFFEDILKEYVMLRYPKAQAQMKDAQFEERQRHLEDSFVAYFRQPSSQNFTEAAQSSLRKFAKGSKQAAFKYGRKARNFLRKSEQKRMIQKKFYQIKGEKTLDRRTKVIELEMPSKQVLELAHAQDATLTIYLIAVFFEAVRKAAGGFHNGETISISVPVNLRQFFPSDSARNFFSTVRLQYTYAKNSEPSVKSICATLTKQLKYQTSKESLERRLGRLIAFEYNPFNRVVPRPLKDGILKIVNYFNNRNITVSMSNLGRVRFPETVDSYIKTVYFHSSVVRPQFSMISHGNKLSITFTSPFLETEIQEQFVRELTGAGVEVTAAANKVTAEELGGNAE